MAIVGTNVAFGLDIIFKSIFAGTQPLWMLSGDTDSNVDISGWQHEHLHGLPRPYASRTALRNSVIGQLWNQSTDSSVKFAE